MNESMDRLSQSRHAVPVDLPTDSVEFRRIDATILTPPLIVECEPALKRMGPPPVARSTFPLMGLFATVYEHIAAHAKSQLSNLRE
ncbi:MAG: hypothetical protein KF841_13285 [Phycisphaerae bacterium]|nr:hypothetical protein [Phycisphaerae bacterium]